MRALPVCPVFEGGTLKALDKTRSSKKSFKNTTGLKQLLQTSFESK